MSTTRYRIVKNREQSKSWAAIRLEADKPTRWTYFTSWRAALAFAVARGREEARIQADIRTLKAIEEVSR